MVHIYFAYYMCKNLCIQLQPYQELTKYCIMILSIKIITNRELRLKRNDRNVIAC